MSRLTYTMYRRPKDTEEVRRYRIGNFPPTIMNRTSNNFLVYVTTQLLFILKRMVFYILKVRLPFRTKLPTEETDRMNYEYLDCGCIHEPSLCFPLGRVEEGPS